ncbi:MAG: hydrolase [Acidobacteriota bacterium]
MKNSGLLRRDETAFLLIDMQEKLMPVISEKEIVFANANKLTAGATILNLPLLVTEQYPNGLGHTCRELQLPDNHEVIEKICFSCLLSQAIETKLQQWQVKSLVLAGVESHICVLKTALDALQHGYQVHIVADAVSSRKRFDKEIALQRMQQSGAFLVTTEMVLFQLIDTAGNAEFKQISKLIR